MHAVENSTRTVKAAELATLVFGIWLAVSPFVLGFSHDIAGRWNNIAVGIAVVLVMLAGEWENEALQGLIVPLSIWLFASPFILHIYTRAFIANNVSMAFVMVTAGAITEGLRMPHSHQGV